VYLGGNIENCADTNTWREDVTKALTQFGVICLNPLVDTFINSVREDGELNKKMKHLRAQGKLNEVAEIMKKVVQKDLRMVDISDFLIFSIDPEKPTWGTTHEIIQAYDQRKPIFFVVDDRKMTPLWLLRFVSEECIFETHLDLTDYLARIHRGEVKLDESRWKILLDVYKSAN
jgi:nucleoside 2-deoxyribosyltransferase